MRGGAKNLASRDVSVSEHVYVDPSLMGRCEVWFMCLLSLMDTSLT